MQSEVRPPSKLDDTQLVKRPREGNREALDELISRYRPLASGLARRYSYTSETADDLGQVASIGLVAAIKRYDPGRGKTLRAFAVPTILAELRRHFLVSGSCVHRRPPLSVEA